MYFKRNFIVLIAILFLLFQDQNTFAQQVIINVPSSDILPKGDVIFKQSNRFSPFAPDAFAALTPSLTVGTGMGTELSGGVATSLDGDTIVRGDFAAKKVFFIGRTVRWTSGLKLNPYLTEEASPDTLAYSHFTKRIRKTKTTLTAGVYVASRKDYTPEKTGVMLGAEQVIIPNKLRLVVDWMSRNESYSALGAGLKYRPVSTVSITSAILIPNGDKGKLAFNVSISKFLSFK